MTMRVEDLVFDCRHPASLARFWAAALDGYEVAPYDDAELARLRELGVFDIEDDPMVVVERTDGDGPRLLFQLTSDAPSNRVRLALRVDDRDSALDRLIGLGARLVRTRGHDAVLADPEGNEFLVRAP
jgi:Glyoxalase-like domain